MEDEMTTDTNSMTAVVRPKRDHAGGGLFPKFNAF